MTLLRSVVAHLEDRHVPCALCGGGALAVHKISRTTEDLDLLALDPAVLEPGFWSSLRTSAEMEIRRGDSDDPLAGLVRWRGTDTCVDLVVPKDSWMRGALDRRVWVTVAGETIPVVGAADLILIKMAAGGPQDLLDVQILLAGGDPGLRDQVDLLISSAPPDLASVWKRIST